MAEENLNLKIDGMHCDACVRRVTGALGAVKSVKVKDVSVGDAHVTYDPASTDEEQIVSAVNGIGFEARRNA